MADKVVPILLQTLKPIKIKKWKVDRGNSISIGCAFLLYEVDEDDKHVACKLKSTQAGTVHKLFAQEGDVVKPGELLLELQACSHPTVMRDMCAECGADLRKDEGITLASVPMVHSVPELKVSLEQAQKIGKADVDRLLKDRKLVLLVDLDQTLIHTTNDNIPAKIKDVYHFQLYGPQSPWYHTRLRPGTHKFLENMSPYFELHICTFGARNYAHMIAMFLDQDGKLFSQRILSRDECFNPTSKTANLKALFPCGDDMVCIIDDREDVWSYATNLIHVKPYHFFQHTGDINAPPGLDKHESDEKEGIDLSTVSCTKQMNGVFKTTDEEKSVTENKIEANMLIANEKVEDINKTKIEESSAADRKEVEQTSATENKIVEVNNSTESETIEENNELQEKTFEGKNVLENETTGENNAFKNEAVVKNNLLKNKAVSENTEPENEIVKNYATENEVIEATSTNINSFHSDLENDEGESKIMKETEGVQENSDEDRIDKNNEQEDSVAKADDVHNKLYSNSIKDNDSKDDLIEIEDPDDYLMYLEDILKIIHKTFYDKYDKLESGRFPDLKKVIPEVRRNILQGTRLVFSGLVPTHIKLEQSKAYQVARSLGAIVTQDLEEKTTHLVAVRPGTAKVNTGRRKKNLKIVTPDWLWACAERWSKVDENLYTLSNKGSKNRHPPPHCSSPEHIVNFDDVQERVLRKRTPSGRFMDTINPLMSFSSADIADMDREVEDIFNESESDGESSKKPIDADEVILQELKKDKDSDDESSSSDESLTGEHPHGWRPNKDLLKRNREDQDLDDESTADEFPSTKFRRGEQLSSDLDIGQDSNSEGSVDAPDEIDDGDWNMMGAALEREFLANN